MVWPDNIDSGRSNSQLGDRSRCCRHCNLVHLLSSHSLKHAAVSSTDQGGGKRRAGLAIIACSWPPLVELDGYRPTDQVSFFLEPKPL